MNNTIRDFELHLEVNEEFYRIAGCFWAQQYYLLEDKISSIEGEYEISFRQALKDLSKGMISIMKKTHNPYKIISNKKHRLFLLYIDNIAVSFNKDNGEIDIKAEHIMGKKFQHTKYRAALAWIQAYLDIDTQPLHNIFFYIQEKFVLNIGADEIAKSSLLSLTRMVLDEKELKYNIKLNAMWSEIYIENSDAQIYRLNIFHKAFNKNPSLLLNQLSKPHEEYIKDEIECVKIYSYNFNDINSLSLSLTR